MRENNSIFNPAIRLMERLRYRSKLILVLVLFILPLLVLGSLRISELNERVGFIDQKRRGIEFITPLRELIETIPQHRGMISAYLAGDQGFRDDMLTKRSEIDGGWAVLTQVDLKLDGYLQTRHEVVRLAQRWQSLKSRALDMTETAAFDAHTKLIAELLGLIRHVANTSGLMLDSELDSYYTIDAIVNRLPTLAEAMGQARAIAAGIAANGEISTQDNIALNLNLERIRINARVLDEGVQQAFQFNPTIQSRLGADVKLLQDAIQQFENTLENDLLYAPAITAKAEAIFDAGTMAIATAFALMDKMLPVLSDMLDERVDDSITQGYIALATLLAVLLILLYLFAGFYYSVLSTVSGLADAIQCLAQGNLATRAQVSTRDEMSDIAAGFNQMAEALQENHEREQHERQEQLRQAADTRARIDLLLTHVKQIADGDLRHSIEQQGDDDLGQLFIHLNGMTKSLVRIAVDIREVTESLSTTVAEVSCVTSSQASTAAQQASAVTETTVTLEEIKQTSRQTLSKAQELGGLAQRTRQESSLGHQAVQETIASMGAIRAQVDGIAQTILALSEQTQQIGDITGVVGDLAQQSKMLALNASIEAAKAGDAGKGFAVVAQEVKALAEQSQGATAQVQKILQDIRQATDRVVMATEEGAKGVDIGVQKVQRTGELMQAVDALINETSMASQQIVAAVRQEAAGIEQVNTAVQDINGTVGEFVTSTRQTEQANNNIVFLADKLRSSVEAYKVN